MADKALLVGINEYETVGKLRGCVNDVNAMETLLTTKFGFKTIKKLTDGQARKTNLKKEMAWLLNGAAPGDRLVFHFSGHGSYTADTDGDEPDGKDQLICLADMDFHKPASYFLDDELREWTGKLTPGARLLVVLDCCHSGSGTRNLVLSRSTEPPQAVILADTANRVSRTRAIDPAHLGGELKKALESPTSEEKVLARFVQPPPEIEAEIAARRRGPTRTRELVPVASLNHFLLSGCRRDQTSADAYIDGKYSGAFTYNLCRAVNELGTDADREALEKAVTKGLHAGHFSQEAQFEGPVGPGTLFGAAATAATTPPTPPTPHRRDDPTPAPAPVSVTHQGTFDVLAQVLSLPPEERRLALIILERQRPAGSASRATGDRALVYVHGISRHVAGYSNDWWKAMRPFVGDTFGDGTLGQKRFEVLWSDLVNARAADADAAAARREVLETIQDRVDRDAVREAVGQRAVGEPAAVLQRTALERGVLDTLGIDDFVLYMTNSSVRAAILERFTKVVRPLLEAGTTVDLIAHSWGTVVAYEGLRELADGGLDGPLVHALFTVGAALSIGPVRWRLRPENRDGKRPANVRRWINVDAKGDMVGGTLVRSFGVNDEFLEREPFGCQRTFFGGYDLSCAHSSYFKDGNEPVNRSIFGQFITA